MNCCATARSRPAVVEKAIKDLEINIDKPNPLYA